MMGNKIYAKGMHKAFANYSMFCTVCSTSLAQGGFFLHDGDYYCTSDYQQRWGTQCGACGRYVEGEVVTALGNTYHQNCFTCARCRKPFPTGAKVTVSGREILCQRCVDIPARGESSSALQNASPLQTVHDNTGKVAVTMKGLYCVPYYYFGM